MDLTTRRGARRRSHHPERIAGIDIFRLPQTPRGPLCLSGGFVDRVGAAALRGAGFQLVWSDGG